MRVWTNSWLRTLKNNWASIRCFRQEQMRLDFNKCVLMRDNECIRKILMVFVIFEFAICAVMRLFSSPVYLREHDQGGGVLY